MRPGLGVSSTLVPAYRPRFSPLAGSKLFRTLAAASSLNDRRAAEFVSVTGSSYRFLSPAVAATMQSVPGARMVSTQGIWLVSFLALQIALRIATWIGFSNPF